MTPEQFEAIHEQLRKMRAAHYSAQWLLEEVVKAIQHAIDGEPLDDAKIRKIMDQYAHAIQTARHEAMAAFNMAQKVQR